MSIFFGTSYRAIYTDTQYCLDQSGLTDILSAVDSAHAIKSSNGKSLCCALCGSIITEESNKTEVEGRHEHFKVNPQGKSFHISCFKNAMGCNCFGNPIAEFSWFTGYVWRYAHCAHCDYQLGWIFLGPEPFYALIKQLLVFCEKPPDQ